MPNVLSAHSSILGVSGEFDLDSRWVNQPTSIITLTVQGIRSEAAIVQGEKSEN